MLLFKQFIFIHGILLEHGYKEEYTYDKKGNMVLEIDYSWSSEKEELIRKEKHKRSYSYGKNNVKLISIGYEWNEDKKAWVAVSKSVSEYINKYEE